MRLSEWGTEGGEIDSAEGRKKGGGRDRREEGWRERLGKGRTEGARERRRREGVIEGGIG